MEVLSSNRAVGMTLQEHIKIAKELIKIRKDLMAMYCMGAKRFKVISKAEQLRMLRIVQIIDRVKCTLDNVYCREVDDKTFQEYGYIYYKVD